MLTNMRFNNSKALFLLLGLLVTKIALANTDEYTIFNDPQWFPVNEQMFGLLYEHNESSYTNKSLLMESGANDRSRYMGGSIDYMSFPTGRNQFALYGHIGYRPKWKIAPYIQIGVDLYSTLIELLSGNSFRINSRISSGLQWTFRDSQLRVFYRSSSLDYSHFTSENGTYTTYGISLVTIVGRSKRRQKNPPVITFNSHFY
ncbi:MAG: hypothetical protein OEX03_00085 [Gammaproteobacteria bacterium]|nr:hypothetical protein [Gammaproteobacteria bacterium]